MSEKKHCVEVYFDDEEIAILKELSTGVEWSIERLVHEAVFRAHFTEEAKKRHAAVRRMLSREPIDWGADWSELKREMGQDMAWRSLKSMGQDQEVQ